MAIHKYPQGRKNSLKRPDSVHLQSPYITFPGLNLSSLLPKE